MTDILDTAQKLGDLVAKHPALEKLADAQKALAADPAASKMLGEFDQKLQVVQRNQQMGQPVTAAERQELEAMQQRIAGDLKIAAFSAAQVDFTDMLRKVSETWQKPIAAKQGEGQPPEQPGPGAPGGTPNLMAGSPFGA